MAGEDGFRELRELTVLREMQELERLRAMASPAANGGAKEVKCLLEAGVTRQPEYGILVKMAVCGTTTISVVGDEEGQWVQVWDLWSSRCVREVGADRVVWGADVSRDGTMVAVGCREVLQVWDVAGGGCVCEFPGNIGGISLVAFSPDGCGVVSVTGTEGGMLRLWDLSSRRCVYQASCGGAACGQLAMAMHAAGPIATTQNGRIYYLSTPGWCVDVHPMQRLRADCASRGAVAMTSDGTAAFFCHENRAEFWDLDEQRFLKAVTHPSGDIRAAAVSDERKGITAGDDCVVRIWNLHSGQMEAEMAGHTKPITGMAHDRTGRFVATASEDCTVRLWDTQKQRAVWHWEFDDEPRLAMSADAGRMAVVDKSGKTYFLSPYPGARLSS